MANNNPQNITNRNQMGQTRDKSGRITGGKPPAGFNKHPENRSNGTWDSKMTPSFQYRRFWNMSEEEFVAWIKETPKNERTVVEVTAWNAVAKARDQQRYLTEITDRVEGKPKQQTDLTTNGKDLFIVERGDKD